MNNTEQPGTWGTDVCTNSNGRCKCREDELKALRKELAVEKRFVEMYRNAYIAMVKEVSEQ